MAFPRDPNAGAPDPHELATVIDYNPMASIGLGRSALPKAPRNLQELLVDTFELYRAHFAILVITAAVALGPIYLARNFLVSLVPTPAGSAALDDSSERIAALGKELQQAQARGAPAAEIERLNQTLLVESTNALRQGAGLVAAALVALVVLLISLPFTMLAANLAQAALMVVVADRSRRGSMSWQDAWRVVGRKLGPLLTTGMLVSALVFVGTLVFVLPGMLVAFFAMFTMPVVLLEHRRGIAALRRSFELVRTEWVKALVLLITFAVLGMVASWVGSLPVPARFGFLRQTMGDLVSLLVLPIPVVGTLLLFQDAARFRGKVSDAVFLASEKELVEG